MYPNRRFGQNRDTPCPHTNSTGMEYAGSTHASGACRPGSIPGIPTKDWCGGEGACRPGSIPGAPTNQDIFQIQRRFVARSPRLRRVSLRKKPCISELNRKVGQIQIQFSGKANGGSFQFFPSMILYHKNHWTKQVFRRGERFFIHSRKGSIQLFPFRPKSDFLLLRSVFVLISSSFLTR